MAAAPAALAQVFSYTGAEQSYVVPTGVTAVQIVAVGAPGAGVPQVPGGRGAVVSAELPIPQGQAVLYVEVGGTGVGFNGGGSDGGDASDVRLIPRAADGSINSRVIVAGGGGGDGNYAGGDAGSDGGGGVMGGQAGTATAGGAGGQGNPPEACTNGQSGSFGQGGNLPGGGGGGYYGGGSGGAIGGPGCGPGSYETPGGGGGGGSSYASPQATQVTFGLDDSRTPQITITPIVTAPQPVTLSGLGVNPHRFVLTGRRIGNRCLAVTAPNRAKPRCKRPIAFRISYQLSGPATVSFSIQQVFAGRLVGGRCRAATHANRLHSRCTLTAQRGTFTQPGATGQNTVAFNGRLGNRLLGAGSYVVTATVAGSSGSTGRGTASFRITS